MAGTKDRNRLDLPNRVKGSLKKELESWAKEFAGFCTQKEDKVPHGWMTINQIAKGIGKSKPTVRLRIMQMEEKGELERRKFKIRTGSRVRSVFHYRKK